MPASRPTTVVAALAACIAAALTARHLAQLRRALNAERAARRLTAGMHHRDMAAFADRLHRAVHAHHTLTEADSVLDSALNRHDPEGGPE